MLPPRKCLALLHCFWSTSTTTTTTKRTRQPVDHWTVSRSCNGTGPTELYQQLGRPAIRTKVTKPSARPFRAKLPQDLGFPLSKKAVRLVSTRRLSFRDSRPSWFEQTEEILTTVAGGQLGQTHIILRRGVSRVTMNCCARPVALDSPLSGCCPSRNLRAQQPSTLYNNYTPSRTFLGCH